MILLCNGDSWTQGDADSQQYSWDSTKSLDWYDIIPNFGEPTCKADDTIRYKFYDSDVWPKVLGKKLGVETWNCGRNGASNDRIIRSTIHSIEYLESLGKKDLFIVVGLTSLLRYSVLNNKKKDTWKHYQLEYNDERLNGQTYPKNVEVKFKNDLIQIIHLQNYLKMKNIPYLIFNAFDDEMENDLKDLSFYKDIDLNNIYNKDFKPHYREFIEKKYNANMFTGSDFFSNRHPTDKSHTEWGKELYKYIRSNYEIF